MSRLFATLWTSAWRILQARILEWVAIPFSRESSQPRDQTQVSHIAGGFFTSWATGESLKCYNLGHKRGWRLGNIYEDSGNIFKKSIEFNKTQR